MKKNKAQNNPVDLEDQAQQVMLSFALEFPDLFKRLVAALEKLAKEMEAP